MVAVAKASAASWTTDGKEDLSHNLVNGLI